MQIQLKQAEIITALKQYISQQGIDLASKNVEMAFTAGRKDSGLSVVIVIEELGFQEFLKQDFSEDEPGKPELTVVVKDTTAKKELATDEDPVAMTDPEMPAAKTTSLFN